MSRYVIIILVMSLVTMIPRILPFIFSDTLGKNKKLKKFFKYIPYTILGMLIIPDIFYSTGNIITGITGFFVAVILSFFRFNSIVVVIITVISVYLLNYFI